MEATTAQIDFLLPTAPQKVIGQVVDQDTNKPLAGAVVTATIKGTSTVMSQAGVTDANGNYALSVVNSGSGRGPNPDSRRRLYHHGDDKRLQRDGSAVQGK